MKLVPEQHAEVLAALATYGAVLVRTGSQEEAVLRRLGYKSTPLTFSSEGRIEVLTSRPASSTPARGVQVDRVFIDDEQWLTQLEATAWGREMLRLGDRGVLPIDSVEVYDVAETPLSFRVTTAVTDLVLRGL